MFRKIVWVLVTAIVVAATGCDYQDGKAAGRAKVREMRKNVGDGAFENAAYKLGPMQGGHDPGKSKDWRAGYRKGYTDELNEP